MLCGSSLSSSSSAPLPLLSSWMTSRYFWAFSGSLGFIVLAFHVLAAFLPILVFNRSGLRQLEGRAEPQLVHSGPLCTANHPVRLFSSKVRGLPYGPWAILGGIELFVFPILEKRDVGSPLRLQPDHLAAAAIASID